jgi:two-component system phosphate regulon response regulator PhoB
MLGGRAIDLSATEFAILEHLARSPGRVFTRTQMIDAIRGHDYPVTDRSIDVQVLGIRKKLGDRADLLETVRGVGYRFRDEQ